AQHCAWSGTPGDNLPDHAPGPIRSVARTSTETMPYGRTSTDSCSGTHLVSSGAVSCSVLTAADQPGASCTVQPPCRPLVSWMRSTQLSTSSGLAQLATTVGVQSRPTRPASSDGPR